MLAIPTDAVLERDRGPVVFVAGGGLAHERSVTVASDLGANIVVSSGLQSGDSLVVVGQEYLEDGDPVNIVATADGQR